MTRGSKDKSGGKPNPVDVHVGSRLRMRRTLLGMSQEKLGEALGLTFQQVQKYERGTNRIGASRLYDLSRILSVPVTFFFEDLMGGAKKKAAMGISDSDQASFEAEDPLAKRETLELVRAYYKIQDPKLRKQLFEMAKAMADTAELEVKKSKKKVKS